MSVMDDHFDDFLGLAARDFSCHRLIAFVGESGSGKSTAIRFLMERHPDFAGRRRDVVVVDEVLRVVDLARLWQLARRGATLLVASHLPAAWFHALGALVGGTVFRTDRDLGKISRYLQRRNVAASGWALEAYVRRFGSTYTDVDIILERFPSGSFDASLAKFLRLCSVKGTKAPATPSGPSAS